MTGYGRGEAEEGGLKWVAEVRSVNHRFLEVSANLPRHLWALEDRVRKLIKARVARGKVEVQLTWEGRPDRPMALRLDPILTTQVLELLNRLQEELPEPEPVRLEHLLCFADLLVSKEKPEQEVEEVWQAVSRALGQALDGLEKMRSLEGAALAEEIGRHMELVRQEMERITALADLLPGLWRQKLRARLAELKEEVPPLEEGRLAQEVALLAERRDIREELARLKSHVAQFQEAMAGPGPIGRKLEFLLQEMFREANTMGVKAGNLDVAQSVLAIKGLLERLREQVQNVE